jgi:hypothetical protein
MTRAAANGSQPFDLDQAQAKIEAETAPFVFTYRGQVYSMRHPNLVPFDIQRRLDEAIEANDDKAQSALMNEMLGSDLFDRLCAAGGFNGAAMQALMEAANASGGGLGPTSAPSRRGSTRK